jgi:predicted transcriptional regulator of viral defense system
MYQRWIDKANSAGRAVPIRIKDLPVIEEYLDWLPEKSRWDRLCEIAAPQEGYCTLAQVRAAGYTDEIFEALRPQGKIERCSGDVYRLTQFPRPDYEGLVALWLQTDMKGVVSHDTALALHNLSDLLPMKRHITVPPEWRPGDRRFDADVRIHEGEISEAEITWLGPVPVTKPLRTLQDCIDADVSPDFIKQAVEDGIRRGLFTKNDISQRVHAASA